jgi:hypothetical protein
LSAASATIFSVGGAMAKVVEKGVEVLSRPGLGTPEPALASRLVGDPSAITQELRTSLARETSRVSDALLMGLEELITSELNKLFGDQPKSFNRARIKKLANSVAAPGAAGLERTMDALEQIGDWDSVSKKTNRAEFAQTLREQASDFRKAKSFLVHQAKCVNAFLNFWDQSEEVKNSKYQSILEKSIKRREDFQSWASTLSKAWEDSGGIDSSKNNKMYVSYWSRFIEAVNSEREDNYSWQLISTIKDESLGANHLELFLKYLNNASLSNRNTPAFKSLSQSSMKVEAGVISIRTLLNVDSSKLNLVKENLAFLCSQQDSLQSKELEIHEELSDGAPTLVVSFASPKELTAFRRTVDLVNKLIKEAVSALN